MDDKRSAGRLVRDALQDAGHRYRAEHGEWPTLRALSQVTGYSYDLARYHIDILFESGIALRQAGTIRFIVRDGTPIIPLATAILDYLIERYIREHQGPSVAPVLVAPIARALKKPRYVISRRCVYLVNEGRLQRVGVGYRANPVAELIDPRT